MKKTLLFGLSIALGLGLLQSCKDDTPTPKTQTPDNGNKESLMGTTLIGNPIATGTIDDFEFAYSSDDVVLLLANNATGKIYAVDIDDENPDDASVNALTANSTTFATDMATAIGLTGGQLQLFGMKVNPVSKALYVLVGNTLNDERNLLKITNNGSQMDVLDLSNSTYAGIQYSAADDQIQDMVWGGGSLYVSYRTPSTLNGYIAKVEGPFNDGQMVSSRATTVFKTNWGGNYFTDAPLETLAYLDINGQSRLSGVTVCAPGFSFPTDSVNGSSQLLQVKEYFNLNTRSPLSVFGVKNAGKTYLIELHSNGRLTRVGEKYLDGSQTNVNANAKYILTGDGTQVAAGLSDEDVKILAPADSYLGIAKFSENQVYAVSANGTLDFNVQLF